MPTMSLYQIQSDFLQIISELEETGGELTPEIEEALQINVEQFTQKCTNYFGVIKLKEHTINNIDEEIKRLTEIKTKVNNTVTRLKQNLLQATLLYGEPDKKGVKRLEFGTFSLSTRRNPKVEIVDETVIPTKYVDEQISFKLPVEKARLAKEVLQKLDIEFKPTLSIMKTRIKEDIEAGIDVPGAYYDKENYSLTIK